MRCNCRLDVFEHAMRAFKGVTLCLTPTAYFNHYNLKNRVNTTLNGFTPLPVPPSFSGSASWTQLLTCLNLSSSGGTFGTTSCRWTHRMWYEQSLLNKWQKPTLPVRGAPNVITFIFTPVSAIGLTARSSAHRALSAPPRLLKRVENIF